MINLYFATIDDVAKSKAIPAVIPIISMSLARNIYTYRIEPKRIFELIDVLVSTWKMAKRDLEKFLGFFERVE